MNSFFEANKHVGIFLLRLFIGLRLCYGVIDNVLSWERMMEFARFLASNNFPFPVLSAALSVYIQLLGSLMILLGFKIRMASLLLVLNFVVAVFFVHVKGGDSVEGTTPALAMLFGCITFLFVGAEKLSIDHYLESR